MPSQTMPRSSKPFQVSAEHVRHRFGVGFYFCKSSRLVRKVLAYCAERCGEKISCQHASFLPCVGKNLPHGRWHLGGLPPFVALQPKGDRCLVGEILVHPVHAHCGPFCNPQSRRTASAIFSQNLNSYLQDCRNQVHRTALFGRSSRGNGSTLASKQYLNFTNNARQGCHW